MAVPSPAENTSEQGNTAPFSQIQRKIVSLPANPNQHSRLETHHKHALAVSLVGRGLRMNSTETFNRVSTACLTVLTLALCGCQGLKSGTTTGPGPIVSLSTASAGFGNQPVGQTSAASVVTVTNTGTAGLTLNGIAISGANSADFGQSNNCGSSLATGASCNLTVTFTPTATGTRSGSVTITDNAPGSPQAVNLTGTGTSSASLQSINHIIFMAEENRSFDTYFGQLPAYWAANGYPQTADGLPAGVSIPSYSGTPPTVSPFHVQTECIDNLSPSWNESHVDWNLNHPTSPTATMDGYAYNAGKYATDNGYTDTAGERAMGYYDWTDLNYYYFMASNFATSDRWFSPAMDRTQINRMYLFAATSHGYAYPPGTDAADNGPLNVPTIFDALNTAGVSWKIYATDDSCPTGVTGSDRPVGGVSSHANSSAPSSSSTGFCTYLTQFKPYAPPNPLPANVVAGTQFLADAQAGTLPAVSFIEPGYLSGQDEHPSSGTNAQKGAAYVETLINGLMSSPSWKDSVFILTYDEAGGTYDHVAPAAMPNPDGISPIDLPSTDICGSSGSGGANCDFNYTGFRVPLLVVSPFTRKNYVSNTPADYTAILTLIEARFKLSPLTKRDAAQMDMTEFFDFQNVPWATPPSNIPGQSTSGVCNANKLGYP
jgi:phospholipase C